MDTKNEISREIRSLASLRAELSIPPETGYGELPVPSRGDLLFRYMREVAKANLLHGLNHARSPGPEDVETFDLLLREGKDPEHAAFFVYGSPRRRKECLS